MKKLITLALVAALVTVNAPAEELVFADATPELVLFEEAPEAALAGDLYEEPGTVLVGDLPTAPGTIPMADALAEVSTENAVDPSLWANAIEEDGDDVLVASADTGDYNPQTQGTTNSRRWRISAGYRIPVVTSYSAAYGFRDLVFVGAPSSNGYAGASQRTLELGRGVYAGSGWGITGARRNFEYLWGSVGVSREVLNWLPVLGWEVYLDLAWATARARDLAEEACLILDDLYALDATPGLFRREWQMADSLVDDFYEVTEGLSRALSYKEEVAYFAQLVLQSGGVNNPLVAYGRWYGGVQWDLGTGTISRQVLDDFIVQNFGWDCIPRAEEDMPWYDGSAPTPAPVPTTTPDPTQAPSETETQSDGTQSDGTQSDGTLAPDQTETRSDTASASPDALTLLIESEEAILPAEEDLGFTDGEFLPVEEEILGSEEGLFWDGVEEELIILG